MPDVYRTIAAPAEAIFREKMSKFMSFAFPVQTEDEARECIAMVQKRYHDARHVCWAYQLGADRSRLMLNDNGEPSGTAGKPILGQINSFELTNVAIAVVRYFGGIKLGTSGLIAAYREAARMALEAAEIVERHEEVTVTVTFGYLAMNDIMRIIKGTPEIRVLEQTFDNACSVILAIRRDMATALAARIAGVPSASADVSSEIIR